MYPDLLVHEGLRKVQVLLLLRGILVDMLTEVQSLKYLPQNCMIGHLSRTNR